jgi:hypothetical protein
LVEQRPQVVDDDLRTVRILNGELGMRRSVARTDTIHDGAELPRQCDDAVVN